MVDDVFFVFDTVFRGKRVSACFLVDVEVAEIVKNVDEVSCDAEEFVFLRLICARIERRTVLNGVDSTDDIDERKAIRKV